MHLAHHNIPGHYGVRTDRYKLAFFYGLPLDGSLGKGNFQPSTAAWELYDLKLDPKETNKLYDKPEYAATIRLLKNRLLELKQQYGDHDEAYPKLMERREQLWQGVARVRMASELAVQKPICQNLLDVTWMRLFANRHRRRFSDHQNPDGWVGSMLARSLTPPHRCPPVREQKRLFG